MTIVLEERLKKLKVEVSVETFEEDEGIAGLGDDPFVSCKMVHVVRTCNISNTLKHLLKHVEHSHVDNVQEWLPILSNRNIMTCIQHRFQAVTASRIFFFDCFQYANTKGVSIFCLPDIIARDEISQAFSPWICIL